jgi:hypothetical protein
VSCVRPETRQEGGFRLGSALPPAVPGEGRCRPPGGDAAVEQENRHLRSRLRVVAVLACAHRRDVDLEAHSVRSQHRLRARPRSEGASRGAAHRCQMSPLWTASHGRPGARRFVAGVGRATRHHPRVAGCREDHAGRRDPLQR